MGVSIREYARRRGVSDTAVRKAINAGRIVKEPDGTINPVKADAAWGRNTDPAQQREPGANLGATPGSQQRFAPPANQTQRFAPPPADPKQGAPDYMASRAFREACAARMAKLDLDERIGELVKSADVKVAAFNTARIVRDRLLVLPHRLAAMLAAETDASQVEKMLEDELYKAIEELNR